MLKRECMVLRNVAVDRHPGWALVATSLVTLS